MTEYSMKKVIICVHFLVAAASTTGNSCVKKTGTVSPRLFYVLNFPSSQTIQIALQYETRCHGVHGFAVRALAFAARVEYRVRFNA